MSTGRRASSGSSKTLGASASSSSSPSSPGIGSSPGVASAVGGTIGVGARGASGGGGGTGLSNPGGNSDSGDSCPVAGQSVGAPIATPASSAASAALLRRRFIQQGLLDADRRLFGIPAGEQEQPADNEDEEQDQDYRGTRHHLPSDYGHPHATGLQARRFCPRRLLCV
jgi:hypothetical protein